MNIDALIVLLLLAAVVGFGIHVYRRVNHVNGDK